MSHSLASPAKMMAAEHFVSQTVPFLTEQEAEKSSGDASVATAVAKT